MLALTVALVTLGISAVGAVAHAQSPVQTLVPRGGGYIVVPHPTGDVYVPLDPQARPQFPAVPGAPSTPAVPPTASPTGYLSMEIEPGAAHVYVDGVYAGLARDLAPGRAAVALRPGLRRVEVVLTGFRSMTVLAEIVPGESRTLTAVLGADPRSTGIPAPPQAGGYFVVPAPGPQGTPPAVGGGYQVIPRQ